MSTETQTTPQNCLNSLGLTLAVISGPRGEVSDNWPCIAYEVELQRNGRKIWAGPYKIGVGHVKWPKEHFLNISFHPSVRGLTGDEENICRIHARGQRVKQAHDSLALEASAASKLAKIQKVFPKITDVMHSLLLDGSPAFDGYSLEDWANEYGYSTDSIKAKETYDTCLQTGLALRRAFTEAELTQLREAFQDY